MGKPPFETQTLKDTYLRIKKNEYHIPSRVGPLARSLIQKLLQADPLQRPCVSKIIEDDFMTMGECCTCLSQTVIKLPGNHKRIKIITVWGYAADSFLIPIPKLGKKGFFHS